MGWRGCVGPVGDYDDPMHMVWHHERHQADVWEMDQYIRPSTVGHPPGVVQSHLVFHHLAEQTNAFVRAGGEKIRAGLRIVEPL